MKTCITLLIIAVTSVTALAQKPTLVVGDKPGWYKIADRHVNYATDHDEILVMGNNHFKQIKLKVTEAPINLMSFTVYYSNDSAQSIQVNTVLNIGEETAATDITVAHAVRKIALVYKTLPHNDKKGKVADERAEVEVWGLK